MNNDSKHILGRQRALVGALIAASFFLVEAGIIEIIIGLDLECHRSLEVIRLAPDPYSVCLPEWQWLFLHAASRGFLWLFNEATPALLAGLSMGVLYSLVGAFSASVFKARGIIVYLIVHVFLIAAIAGLSYLGRFIA